MNYIPKELNNIILNYKEQLIISERKEKVLNHLMNVIDVRNKYIGYKYQYAKNNRNDKYNCLIIYLKRRTNIRSIDNIGEIQLIEKCFGII